MLKKFWSTLILLIKCFPLINKDLLLIKENSSLKILIQGMNKEKEEEGGNSKHYFPRFISFSKRK
jgi:hypothetical protein